MGEHSGNQSNLKVKWSIFLITKCYLFSNLHRVQQFFAFVISMWGNDRRVLEKVLSTDNILGAHPLQNSCLTIKFKLCWWVWVEPRNASCHRLPGYNAEQTEKIKASSKNLWRYINRNHCKLCCTEDLQIVAEWCHQEKSRSLSITVTLLLELALDMIKGGWVEVEKHWIHVLICLLHAVLGSC